MAQTLEQRIRRVIKEHYGEELWSFREDVNYKDATKAFVAEVARAIKGEVEYASDLTDEVAKYNKGGGIDRTIGGNVRKLRIKKGVDQEQLAASIGVCGEFLDALESGRIPASAHLYVEAYHALKPTKNEMATFTDGITQCKKPEEMIRDVIETYYGMGLWSFMPNVGYEEAIEPFIKSLTALVKP
jgi:transcriptional regulator with XRE-family HTH domain